MSAKHLVFVVERIMELVWKNVCIEASWRLRPSAVWATNAMSSTNRS